jgi:periplasmic divalent cation tolerance protein
MKSDPVAAGACVVFVTAASAEQAGLIAHALVGERLAACVNVVSPIRSIYRWNDEVQSDTEHLLIVKTRANLVAKVAVRVKELHSYEVPEVIALPIVAGAKSYLDWLFASTTAEPRAVSAGRRTTSKRRRTK